MPKFRCASFFAGIGGFDLGFERAEVSSVFQCEIDEYCQTVLERHWPEVERRHDVRALVGEEIPDADVWCGGFPCQDVSVARGWLGRDGLKGENSGLFYPFAGLIGERRPTVVLLENVAGLLNSHGGKDFGIILKTFERLGYGVAWRMLNTRYFGAPQSRPRVFICAWRSSTAHAYHSLFDGAEATPPEKPRLGFLRESKCKKTGARVPEVAFCLAATSGRHTGTDWSRSYVSYEDEVRRLTPTECERIQGYPPGWTLPAENVASSGDDLDSLRYKAAGNAVSVPVVEWIARRIVEQLSEPAEDFARGDLFEPVTRFADRTPSLNEKGSQFFKLPDFLNHEDAPEIRWGNGGVMEDGDCISGPVPQWPIHSIHSRLVDVLDEEKPDDRYFLSPNAAKGILRRVNGQGRQLFEPLAKALDRLQVRA